MSRRKPRPLTDAEREFYAGFKQIVPAPNPIKAGDRVIIVGDHPHSGGVGVFVAFRSTIFGEYPVVKFDEPHYGVEECFVMNPNEWRRFS